MVTILPGMRLFALLSLPVVAATLVRAAAILPDAEKAQDRHIASLASREVTALSAAALSAVTPFAHFAAAAYCPSDHVKRWGCGGACSALPGFEVTLTGGDGAGTQLFYVGYWPEQKAAVVAHQGTDPTEFLADLTDINFFLQDFDDALFPGLSVGAQGHGGFLGQHAKTAHTILSEVKRIISAKGATNVITIGHSLGGALAELDSLFFTLNLPSNIHVRGVTFGTPRVGNAAYADFFNAHVNDFERINNKKDPVPIVPGRGVGFTHVHGEIHIVNAGNAVACSGNDDASDASCTIKTVPNIFKGNILDHLGPYNGVLIGTIFCG